MSLDFVSAFTLYTLLCCAACLLYAMRETRLGRVLIPRIGGILRACLRLVPVSTRRFGDAAINWIFFERHYLFQVCYVVFVLTGHSVLITDVVATLYQYAWTENHVLVGIACLFINIIAYSTVCLTDPGVITSRNAALYSRLYDYDGRLHRCRVCTVCTHAIPARAKHCNKCEQCVHRFDHHCVWTNCCIGGHNYAAFFVMLASLVGMATNAVWLCLLALFHYTKTHRLWQATYLDAAGNEHEMDWTTLVQHLFMTFPRVVAMASGLSMLDALLIGYFLYHVWLTCTNQTTWERYRESVLTREKRKRRESMGQSDFDADRMRLLDEQNSNHSSIDDCSDVQPVTSVAKQTVRSGASQNSETTQKPASSKCYFYDQGLYKNLSEVFLNNIEQMLRAERRKLPVPVTVGFR